MRGRINEKGSKSKGTIKERPGEEEGRREISGRGTELEAGSKERNGETEGEKEREGKGQRPRRNLLDRESRRCEMKPDGAHTLLVCADHFTLDAGSATKNCFYEPVHTLDRRLQAVYDSATLLL